MTSRPDPIITEALCLAIVREAYANWQTRRTYDRKAPEPVMTVAYVADDIGTNRGCGGAYSARAISNAVRLAFGRLLTAKKVTRSRASGARGGGSEAWAYEPREGDDDGQMR
jgi:hypothetical protein